MRFKITGMQMRRKRYLAMQKRDFCTSKVFYAAGKVVELADRVNYHDETMLQLTDIVNKNHATIKGIAAAMIDHIGSEDAHRART